MPGVLADTSIWIRHFRRADAALQSLILDDRVLCHPLIVIEIACGSPPSPRGKTLDSLRNLRQPTLATPEEILAMIERHRIADSGCGAVDVALLASALLTPGVRLWTANLPLASVARRLGVDYDTP